MNRSSFLKSLVALGAACCVNPMSLFSENNDANFEYWKTKWEESEYTWVKGDRIYFIRSGDITFPSWVHYVKLHRTSNLATT